MSALMNENENKFDSNCHVAPLQDRKPVLYRKDDELRSNEISAEPSEEFFELTTSDVKLMQKRIEETRNRALVTQEYVRNQNDSRRRQAYQFTVVRILFADRFVLQGNFRSTEPVAHVFDFVRNFLNSNVEFELVLPPNEILSQTNKQLIEADLSPSSLVVFRAKEKERANPDGSYLKPSVIAALKSANDAALIAQDCLSQNCSFVPYVPVISNDEGSMDTGGTSSSVAQSSKVSSSGPSPKWLKMGPK